MKAIVIVDDLAGIDSVEPFPEKHWAPGDYERLMNLVNRAMRRFERTTALKFTAQGPSEFQDGSLFMAAIGTLGNSVSGAFGFSKFANLVRYQTTSESSLSLRTWEEMTEVLCRDYGFLFVSDALLRQEYTGPFKAYRCRTWLDRFFSEWYSHPSRAGRRSLKESRK